MQMALDASISLLLQMQAASVGEQVEFTTAVVKHFAYMSMSAHQYSVSLFMITSIKPGAKGKKEKRKTQDSPNMAEASAELTTVLPAQRVVRFVRQDIPLASTPPTIWRQAQHAW